MRDVKPLWLESGAVLVCEKCYRTRIPDESPEAAARIGSFQLRDWLKAACKQAGLGKRVRVVATGCLDVCAKERVTVGLVPMGNPATSEFYAIDPLDERETILARILTVFHRPERP